MTKAKEKKGSVVIISGPSGVGKSTICHELVKRLPDVYLSISVTTRPKGSGETDGRDYWFISEQQFKQRIENGKLLEYAKVFDHWYGTPKDEVEKALKVGKIVILEIDVQGAKQVKAVYTDAIMIFILPPSAKVLAERMDQRGREKPDMAEVRLNGASNEIAAAWQYYKHMVINEDLQQAVREIAQIIRASVRNSVLQDDSAANVGEG
jgi:guanylate kinase